MDHQPVGAAGEGLLQPVPTPAEAEGAEPTLASLADRLETAEFRTSFHGYDPRAVHALLGEIAAALRSGLAPGGASPPVDDLRDKVAGNVAELMARAAAEIQGKRQEAQQAAEAELSEARARATQIVGDARVAAADLLREAEAHMAEVQAEQGRLDTYANELLEEAAQKAERAAQETLATARRHEEELEERIAVRAAQLTAIEDELTGLAGMAADLLNVTEFLAGRVGRLRSQTDAMRGDAPSG